MKVLYMHCWQPKKRGEKVYGEFNGHILHSDTVSMDSAYTEILGCTKAEYDKRMAEWQENYEKEERLAEQRAIQNIPKWIEIGQTLIQQEKYKDWEECVNARATDLYHGLELDAALEIMQALEDGIAIEDALEILDNQRHSNISELLVRKIILLFSSRGREFWTATARTKFLCQCMTDPLEKILFGPSFMIQTNIKSIAPKKIRAGRGINSISASRFKCESSLL